MTILVCYHFGSFANFKHYYLFYVRQHLAGYFPDAVSYNPKSVISVMMITTLVFEQMFLRSEGAMGFHCNRKTERQMTKRKFVSA